MQKRKKKLNGSNLGHLMRLDGLQTTETSQVNKSSYVANDKKKPVEVEDSDECEMEFEG